LPAFQNVVTFNNMTKILLIVLGGGIGSLLRYLTYQLASGFYQGNFPLGTLFVNAIGSLVIGILWGMYEQDGLSENTKGFVFIGVLGGFTTFSAFALETHSLFGGGEFKLVILNILLNNLLAISMVFLGYIFSKSLLSISK